MAAVSRWLGIAVGGDSVCARDGEQAYCVRLCALWGVGVSHITAASLPFMRAFRMLEFKVQTCFHKQRCAVLRCEFTEACFSHGGCKHLWCAWSSVHGTRSLPNAAFIAVDLQRSGISECPSNRGKGQALPFHDPMPRVNVAST